MELDSCSTHWNRHSIFRGLFISAGDGARDSFREALYSIQKQTYTTEEQKPRVNSATIAVTLFNTKRARVLIDHS